MNVPVLTKLGNYGDQGRKHPVRGDEIAELLGDYGSLIDLLPGHDAPAICEPSNPDKQPLTHKQLKDFIQNGFDLGPFGVQRGQRVAVVLPNGPELAVAVLSVVSRYCAAPINPTNTWQEIKSELLSTRSVAMLILGTATTNAAALEAALEVGVAVISLSPSPTTSGLFSLTSQSPASPAFTPQPLPTLVRPTSFVASHHPETVLVLHTSGTSGTKKVVPYSLDMIIIGVASIVASWNLSPADVCLNMMPLFHIGGIVRNILSPILSGGAVVCCSGFDPVLFWDVLYSSANPVTWYYAAPTMHHAILTEAETRPQPLPVRNVRFIANAAGGLLPVLAQRLKDTFQAIILTSYGMTECMPISTPPQNYVYADRVGTSGTIVGPQLLITDDDMNALGAGQKGNIMIRGSPCFGGYENVDPADSPFFTIPGHGAGWFNTGDMGSLDRDGFLYISGRSKEIINRGGETISPFEIEEACIQHPFVKDCLAFAAPHEDYQETVGLVVVTQPGSPRVDLFALHRFLEERLHRSKWPQVLIYMDALPKNSAGKVLRIRLAERCRLTSVDEESSPLTRLFSAACPPVGAALSTPVALQALVVAHHETVAFLRRQPEVADAALCCMDLPSYVDAQIACVVLNPTVAKAGDAKGREVVSALHARCCETLHGYLVPVHVYSVAAIPSITGPKGATSVDATALQALAQALYAQHNVVGPRNAIEEQVEKIWRTLLGSPTTISVEQSFFALGGDSLKAGQVVSTMRSELRVPLTVADLFTSPTIAQMAAKVSTVKSLGSPLLGDRASQDKALLSPGSRPVTKNARRQQNSLRYKSALQQEDARRQRVYDEFTSYDSTTPHSSTSYTCLLAQLLPIGLIYPSRRILIWFLIAVPWVHALQRGYGRLEALIAAMIVARLCVGLLLPLLGVACKWAIIGRYQAGKFPLWGSMYLKYWIVDQIVNIMGKGFFRDDIPIVGVHLVRLYYVLMGASIGWGVKIQKDVKMNAYDLVTLGDDVALDACTIRPFALEEGHFVLLPITLGRGCSVGVKSVVTPGTTLPPHTNIGPLSSSLEADDASDAARQYCRPLFPAPPLWMVLFLGIPVLTLVYAASMVPWYFVLRAMVQDAKANGWYLYSTAHEAATHGSDLYIHDVYTAFLWWTTPQRLFYFLLLRVVKRCVVPFIRLALAIAIKRLLIGRFVPLSYEEKRLPVNAFRYWLMAKLLPGAGLGGVARLVGTHYEYVSCIYRALGAEIGERVYWPGSGLDVVEFDLLRIGDDVVFGSRSVVMPSSSDCSKPITIRDGAMVADRCVLLPGVEVSRGAVMGSGALGAEDMAVPVGSVFIGSQHGRALCAAPKDDNYLTSSTLSPFGKAFYLRQAPYFVIPLWGVALYNILWQAVCTCYRNCGLVLSLILCSRLNDLDPDLPHTPLEVFQVTLLAYAPVHMLQCALALFVDVASKWALLGRRQAGVYPWDQSSYCQRWQLHLTLQEIRRGERSKCGVLDLLRGSAYLCAYFRLQGARIGTNVCLYPNGGDPMMTEPELITIGDNVSVDDASLIAHINTRGVFRLNPVTVQAGCVLKTMCRVLSGGTMQPHSVLREHSLVMAGESVEAGAVWQGWPNRSQVSLHEHREDVRHLLDQVALDKALSAIEVDVVPDKAIDRAAGGLVSEETGYGAVPTENLSSAKDDSAVGRRGAGEREPLIRKK